MPEPDVGRAAIPLRIGIDVREWRAGTSTGIARVIAGFVGWAIDNTGHQLLLLGNQETDFRIQGPRVEVRVEAEGIRLWWDQVVLPRMLQEAAADVFLSPYYKAPLRAPCPVVVTANDLIELDFPPGGIVGRAALSAWMRLMLRSAAHVLTLSEYSRRDIIERLGIDPMQVTAVSLAPDDRFLRPVTAAARQTTSARLQLPERYVLYVGRCTEHKNVSTLLEAWRGLPEPLRQQYALVLAGSDRERFRLAAEAAEVDVLLPGFVDDGDMPALYSGATLMCFPSMYEGFGLPPLEAMACGVAVIAADATAVPEAVGDAALLVDPLDVDRWREAIEELLTDGAARQRFVRAGFDRARLLQRRHSGARLLDCLVAAVERTR